MLFFISNLFFLDWEKKYFLEKLGSSLEQLNQYQNLREVVSASISINLFIKSNSMKQSKDQLCSCYGPFAQNSDKFFLTRKRERQQIENPFTARRVNKSAQLKTDSEGKTLKKSLKKRPGSSIGQPSLHPSTPIDQVRIEIVPIQDDQHQRQKQYSHKVYEGHNFVHHQPNSHINWRNFPETTTHSKNFFFLTKQQPTNQNSNIHYKPEVSNFHQEKAISQLRPQIQQYKNSTSLFNSPSFAPEKQRPFTMTDLKGKQINSKESLLHQDIYFSSQLHSYQHRKDTLQTLRSEETLLIQGFERIMNEDHHNKSYRSREDDDHRGKHNSRQVHQTKRLEKNQMFGRFAQSDSGQSDSQSPPSQVIGRGFDRTYQDMLDYEHQTHEETKASRSTNTKVSELHIGQKRMSQHQAPNIFGTASHFKSYKNL